MQQQASNYVINADLLGALGALWGRASTRVSPFQHGTATLGTVERKALSTAGFCNEQGQIAPQVQPVLDILGTATSFTRIYLSGGPNPYEYLVYFAPGGASASLVNVHGDMQIDSPALATMFLSMAAETIGSSLYRSSPFEANLSPDEAVVLGGMIDLQRKAALRSLAGDKGTGGNAMDLTAIQASCSAQNDDNQWLSVVISGLTGTGGLPAGDIRKILDSLITKGLVRSSNSSYSLSDDVQFLARRMLVFDTALTLTAGHLGTDGAVTVAGFTCLQAGVHDLLVLDASGGNVSIRSISSVAILDLVRTFVTDASELEKLETPGPVAAQPPAAKVLPPVWDRGHAGAKVLRELWSEDLNGVMAINRISPKPVPSLSRALKKSIQSRTANRDGSAHGGGPFTTPPVILFYAPQIQPGAGNACSRFGSVEIPQWPT